jgi:hypothetical protein
MNLSEDIIKEFKRRGIIPVEGLRVSELTGSKKRVWAQSRRNLESQFYKNEGGIILGCLLGDEGPRRAKEYIRAYEIMTDDQIMGSYLREGEVIISDLKKYSDDYDRLEREARKVKIVVK